MKVVEVNCYGKDGDELIKQSFLNARMLGINLMIIKVNSDQKSLSDVEETINEQLILLKEKSKNCSDKHLKGITEAMLQLMNGLVEIKKMEGNDDGKS
ncbi:hypothetical protein ACYSNR_09240 [Enterococcus sp. LJL128]